MLFTHSKRTLYAYISMERFIILSSLLFVLVSIDFKSCSLPYFGTWVCKPMSPSISTYSFGSSQNIGVGKQNWL